MQSLMLEIKLGSVIEIEFWLGNCKNKVFSFDQDYCMIILGVDAIACSQRLYNRDFNSPCLNLYCFLVLSEILRCSSYFLTNIYNILIRNTYFS